MSSHALRHQGFKGDGIPEARETDRNVVDHERIAGPHEMLIPGEGHPHLCGIQITVGTYGKWLPIENKGAVPWTGWTRQHPAER